MVSDGRIAGIAEGEWQDSLAASAVSPLPVPRASMMSYMRMEIMQCRICLGGEPERRAAEIKIDGGERCLPNGYK